MRFSSSEYLQPPIHDHYNCDDADNIDKLNCVAAISTDTIDEPEDIEQLASEIYDTISDGCEALDPHEIASEYKSMSGTDFSGTVYVTDHSECAAIRSDEPSRIFISCDGQGDWFSILDYRQDCYDKGYNCDEYRVLTCGKKRPRSEEE